MSLLPALIEDRAPLAHDIELSAEQTAYELLISLEQTGAATKVSLALPGVDWDTYVAVGNFMGEIGRRTAWYIGDWLVHGEDNFGEQFAQASAITGLSEQTLLSRMFVCKNIPPKRRMDGVSFSIHTLVARLEPEEQTKWLKLAKSKGLSYAEMKDRMKALRKDSKPQGQLDGTGEHDPDPDLLIEVADAILRDAVPATDGVSFVISRELMARLRGAMGKE